MKYTLALLVLLSACFSSFVFALERIVINKDIELVTESFGENKNPGILLIMGAGTSKIFWPRSFC